MPVARYARVTKQPAHWGLRRAPAEDARAQRMERRWRMPILLALMATIPAFYSELLEALPNRLAGLAYALAAAVVLASLVSVARGTRRPLEHALANPLELVLALGMLLAALAPPSHDSNAALALRLVVAFLTLARMVWGLQHLVTRGGLAYLLLVAGVILALCGVGFWWLEPRTPTLADGLWLAFTTAATVGYGDVVPSTPASKIFSVFVVMLGFGVLTLVTAAIAARWVEDEERNVEREILAELRRQMHELHVELATLRAELRSRDELRGGDNS